jgi:hypothetical protein
MRGERSKRPPASITRPRHDAARPRHDAARPLRAATRRAALPTVAALQLALAVGALDGCARAPGDEIRPESAGARGPSSSHATVPSTSSSAAPVGSASASITPSTVPIMPPGEPPAVAPRALPSGTGRSLALPPPSARAPAKPSISPREESYKIDGGEFGVRPGPGGPLRRG